MCKHIRDVPNPIKSHKQRAIKITFLDNFSICQNSLSKGQNQIPNKLSTCHTPTGELVSTILLHNQLEEYSIDVLDNFLLRQHGDDGLNCMSVYSTARNQHVGQMNGLKPNMNLIPIVNLRQKIFRCYRLHLPEDYLPGL